MSLKSLMLSDNELAVMMVLWRSPKSLSRTEILAQMVNNRWNPNSIHLVLNNLIKKGYVGIGELARCGQSHGRTYLAAKTRGEYITHLALSAVPGIPQQECVMDIMTAMIKGDYASQESLDRLRQLLEERCGGGK